MKKLFSIFFSLCAFAYANAQDFVRTNDGYMIPVSKVTRMVPSSMEDPSSLSILLESDTKVSLFVKALQKTGLIDTLKCFCDRNYRFNSDKDRIDSCTWSNNRMCVFTAAEYDNVAYPERRYYQHTLFIVPDSIYKERGITTLEALDKLAHDLYDPMYPEDASVSDYKNNKNALNRYCAYHILPFTGDYYRLTEMDGSSSKLANNFNRKHKDISDYYETCMPHSIMKFSYPMIGAKPGLYINRRGVQTKPDRGVFVEGALVSRESLVKGVNGLYYYISDIIAYDKTTQESVLNERMRFDCTTLSPDFMTRLWDGDIARGHMTTNSDMKYGMQYKFFDAMGNKNTCIGFKPGFVRNIKYSSNTHLHVRNRYLWFWSYAGDEVTIKGKYDVEVKLPPVPAGKYEVRVFNCSGFSSRGIVQFSIDDVAMGFPIDMRDEQCKLGGKDTDASLIAKESIMLYDRKIKHQGFMKAPADYSPGDRTSAMSDTDGTFRDYSSLQRHVIGTFTTDGKSDHYLRMLQLNDAGGEMAFDFIELVPQSVYDDEVEEEDIY